MIDMPKPEKLTVTLEDIAFLFQVLVRQNQKVNPKSVMSFDLKQIGNMKKRLNLVFEKKAGRLFVSIPVKPSDRKKKKSNLYLPNHNIISPN